MGAMRLPRPTRRGHLYLGVEDHPDYQAPADTFARIDRAFYRDAAELVVALARRLDGRLDEIASRRR
jgi:hypothetical protein